MKVYEALAKGFQSEDVKAVFGLMGDGNMYWMHAMDELGVPLYEVRHEGNALAMADGWAHNNGGVGVCTTTAGPGVSQLATSLLVASRGSIPVVAFCGEAPLKDTHYHQGLDQQLFATATESGYVQVSVPELAYEAVQQAFYRAVIEKRPIILSAPMDIQMASFEDDEVYVPSRALLNTCPAYPHPNAVSRATDIISKSERPVIIVGTGARFVGAGNAIRHLAQRIGALIATTMPAKNWLIDDEYHVGISGAFATRTAIEFFAESDCVIGVGASLNHYTTEHGYLFPNATFVQVDIKPQVLMGDGRSADCYITADAELGVVALDQELESRQFYNVGYRTVEVKDQLQNAWKDDDPYEATEGTLDPREVCKALDDLIPSEMGLVIGGGGMSGFPIMLMTRSRVFTHARKGFGCIGQGMGHTMGASLAMSRTPAVLLEGDASVMMNFMDFDTAVRYDIPLLVCVFNDEALGAEYHKSVTHGLKGELACIPTPDMGAVGVALGGRGAVVRTLDGLREAVSQFVSRPSPMVIDIRISRIPSIQYRRILYGQENA